MPGGTTNAIMWGQKEGSAAEGQEKAVEGGD